MHDLVEYIINNSKCGICGGSRINGICSHCGEKSIEVEVAINKLVLNINSMDLFDLDSIKELFKIKDLVTDIDKFLEEKNVHDFLVKKEEEIISKVTTQGYQDQETAKYIQFLSIYEKDLNKKRFFSTYVIMSNFLRINEYSKDEYKESLKSYAASYMDKYAYTSRFEIENIDDDRISGKQRFVGDKEYNASIITINSKEFDSMYNGKSLDGLRILLHEIRHLQQKSLIKGAAVFDKDTIRQVKDFVLSDYLPGYYQENYHNLTFELDAEISSCKSLLYCFDDWNAAIPARNRINSLVNDYEEKYKSNIRKYEGVEYNLDDLFDKFIQKFNSEIIKLIIEQYPQIGIIYEIKDDKYVRKTEDKLNRDVELLRLVNESRINNYLNNVSEKRR